MDRECPLCKNNAYKWTKLDEKSDLFIVDGRTVTQTVTTYQCPECGLILQVGVEVV